MKPQIRNGLGLFVLLSRKAVLGMPMCGVALYAAGDSILKAPLTLAQFKPALAINPDIQAHYFAHRLRVVRQLCHSATLPA